MIIENVQLQGYQRARCWINDLPEIPKVASLKHSVEHKSSGEQIVVKRKAAIEWLVPSGISMYGLLGAELTPAKSGFTIEIASVRAPMGSFDDAIASKASEDVRVGLLDEYSEAVFEGMSEIAVTKVALPCAKLTCDIAACGMVGSSEIIFKALGRALISLLLMPDEPNEECVRELLVFS